MMVGSICLVGGSRDDSYKSELVVAVYATVARRLPWPMPAQHVLQLHQVQWLTLLSRHHQSFQTLYASPEGGGVEWWVANINAPAINSACIIAFVSTTIVDFLPIHHHARPT